MRRLERNVGASHITFLRPHWSPSFPREYPGRLLYPEYGKALARKRSARGRVLASSVIEVRAILLSPSCAELAGLELQRFRSLSAFTAGCCPLFLSEPGQPVFLEHPSNSSRLHRRSQSVYHGARSQYRGYWQEAGRHPTVCYDVGNRLDGQQHGLWTHMIDSLLFRFRERGR
jgi:hypothetical protein